MIEKLKGHRDDFGLRIAGVSSLQELKQLRSDFLGKKGCVSLMLKEMRSLPSGEKPQAGKHINEFKQSVETLIHEKALDLEIKSDQGLVDENFDTTLLGRGEPPGSIHPVTQIMDEIISIFFCLGFSI